MDGPKINNENGWIEVVLADDCGYETFYCAAEILQGRFSFQPVGRLEDFDSLYWDFQKDKNRFTLYYNIYLGVRLHPTRLEKGNKEEEREVLQVAQELFELPRKHS